MGPAKLVFFVIFLLVISVVSIVVAVQNNDTLYSELSLWLVTSGILDAVLLPIYLLWYYTSRYELDVIITISCIFVIAWFVYGLVTVWVCRSAACEAQTLWIICVIRIMLFFGQIVPVPDLKK